MRSHWVTSGNGSCSSAGGGERAALGPFRRPPNASAAREAVGVGNSSLNHFLEEPLWPIEEAVVFPDDPCVFPLFRDDSVVLLVSPRDQRIASSLFLLDVPTSGGSLAPA